MRKNQPFSMKKDKIIVKSRRNQMDELYRITRVAKILDCHCKNVYYLIRQGKLKALRMGPRQTRVSKTSLEKYIQERFNMYHRGEIPEPIPIEN
jgi:excisionase family DNA binding protein